MGKISKTWFDYLPKISKEGIPQCYISTIQGQGEINNIKISNYSLVKEEQNNKIKNWTKSGKMKYLWVEIKLRIFVISSHVMKISYKEIRRIHLYDQLLLVMFCKDNAALCQLSVKKLQSKMKMQH